MQLVKGAKDVLNWVWLLIAKLVAWEGDDGKILVSHTVLQEYTATRCHAQPRTFAGSACTSLFSSL